MEKEIVVKKNNFEFQVIDSDVLHRPEGYDYWGNHFSDSEPFVFEVYDKFLATEKDFLDIGAWVGPNTLYACKISRKVVAIEPDPVAFDLLKKSISANNFTNVLTFQKALSSNDKLALCSNREFGDSMTKVSDNISDANRSVDSIKMDELLSIGDYSLMKIDIEGYESVAIPDFENILIDANIPMVISFHTSFNPDKMMGHKKLISSLSSIYNTTYDDKWNRLEVSNIEEGFGCFLLMNE